VNTNEDNAVSITLTATDIEGDPLTYSIVGSPTHGTLSGLAATLTYTPDTDYNGLDSFTFKANDGILDSNIAIVSITINPVNDAPIANAQAVITDEDNPVSITLTATDTEDDPLTYSIVGSPTHGTLSGSAPTLTYIPDMDYNGPDSFTFKANDGLLDSNTATVTITINSVNDAPVANDQSVITDEDNTVSITLTASDVESDPLTYSILSGPTHGVLGGSAPALTYTPDTDYNGPDSFTFKVNDGTLDSNTAIVTIIVEPINDAPVANSQSVITDEDNAVSITLIASDIEGDPLTFSVVSGPGHGTLSGSPPDLIYTPDTNYNGPDSFTFKANDGSIDSNTATVSITIEPINDAPVANSQNVHTFEENTVSITLTAIDIEGSPLTYSILTNPVHGVLSGSVPTLTYTPDTDYYGSDSLTFKANDGILNSNTATVTITIHNVNDAPVANSQNVITDEDIAISILLTANDIDSSSLTYTVVSAPTYGILTEPSPMTTLPILIYTPNANYYGTDSFTFKANDGIDDSNIATISLTINSINDAPIANDQSKTINEDTTVIITLGATDFDGDTLTYSILSGPSHGILSGTEPTLTYIPDTDYNGPDSYTFKVNDGISDSNTATVNIIIVSVNDAPVANSQTVITDQGISVSVILTASDIESDPLTYSVMSGPLYGTLGGIAPDLTYTPDADYYGSDSFTFKADDGDLASNLATVSITIIFTGNTPEDENVIVTPIDTTTGDSPVTMVFDKVLQGGETTLTTSGTGTPPPTGFKLGAPPTYFEITTTALYEGNIKICIDYSGLTFSGAEENIRLNHLEDRDGDGILEWYDVTDEGYPNTGTKMICGTITSFSSFAIFEPIDFEPPVIMDVIATPNPVEIGNAITLTATIDDSTTGDSIIASAEYELDGITYAMSAVDGAFDEVIEEATATIPAFAEPGIHTIFVRGEDNFGEGISEESIFLAVYDPNGGFVTGGGWINSPEGAYGDDPTLTGKANFGFISKYKKGATTPTGKTEFQFKAGDLNFHSDTYEWLVVAGARAMFKGTGTINGEGEYKFILTAIDGDLQGGGGADKFRIKIWVEDEVTGEETIIYDNMLGAEEDAELGETTELGGGSIVIHKR
jgi:hypothetical protein